MRSTHSGRYRLFLRRLQAARKDAGMTQGDVARAVGRPQSFVSKCESGERRIDAVELLELAEIYGKSVGYFVAEGEGRSGAMVSSEGPPGAGSGKTEGAERLGSGRARRSRRAT